MVAACEGHVKTVRCLAKCAKLDLKDRDDKTIIHLAALNNQHNVIKVILDLHFTPTDFMVNENDFHDNTPLHIACTEGFLDTVKVLIEHKAQVENKNEDEKTPFHLAAENGHAEVVDFILKGNKNVLSDCDEDGNTALHLAASSKMTNTLERLIDNGSDVRRRNNRDWTPLDCAAAAGAYNCAQKLLDDNADVDPVDKNGTTPLHLTAAHGHPRLAGLLIERGARIDRVNTDGKNALELAILHNNKDVAEVIIDSKQWKRAMRTSSEISSSIPDLDTPFRMLIRKFPDLAAKVMDKCIAKKQPNKNTNKEGGVDENKIQECASSFPVLTLKPKSNLNRSKIGENQISAESEEVEFDFSFLEDTFNYDLKTLKKDGNLSNQYQFNPNSGKPYTSHKINKRTCIPSAWASALEIQENHPLMIMVENKRRMLIKHPLCLALLKLKWQSLRLFFYLQVFYYLLFLGLITWFVLMVDDIVNDDRVNDVKWPIFVYIFLGVLGEITDIIRVIIN